MHYLTSIRLFPIYQPHQRFLTVVEYTRITARRNQAYGVRFQKQFTQRLIACGCVCNGFQKYLYISDPQIFASKHLACLSQNSDVILAVRFLYSLVIEDQGTLTILLLEKFCSFSAAHLIYTVIR